MASQLRIGRLRGFWWSGDRRTLLEGGGDWKGRGKVPDGWKRGGHREDEGKMRRGGRANDCRREEEIVAMKR